jgi:hypothetical protein
VSAGFDVFVGELSRQGSRTIWDARQTMALWSSTCGCYHHELGSKPKLPEFLMAYLVSGQG